MDTTLIIILLVVAAYVGACVIHWRRLNRVDLEKEDRGHPTGGLR